jgi:hypothetical protein
VQDNYCCAEVVFAHQGEIGVSDEILEEDKKAAERRNSSAEAK